MAGKKSLILCFDGTGNKFSGTSGDSNIVKIYSLLDREDPLQCHYYQPGIGTYVETSSLSQKSRFGKIKSWYTKAKDQAVGTSFGEHVMSGYKFLMRYYAAGDDIYFFGFSRGAYTARFLAQMLDYIGLLSTGNEEMLRFAWKTFARWQMRTDESDEEKKRRRTDFEFMCKFRETFSRPIESIRFIGLFDCVNSVPQFESAWMRRTKFPYTAKTTARFIRHAVSIDERRAKFRQDLISETRAAETSQQRFNGSVSHEKQENTKAEHPSDRPGLKRSSTTFNQLFRPHPRHKQELAPIPASSAASQISVDSTVAVRTHQKSQAQQDDEHEEQDILEVWFAGQHGDIGGGWPTTSCDERSASEMPLVWMLREAMRAGMPLDDAKLAKLCPDNSSDIVPGPPDLPTVLVDGNTVPTSLDWASGKMSQDEFDTLSSRTRLHDSLRFGGGLKWYSVLSWNIMENLPFRRMDLQPDGSWKPISWPLPRGETRDMPNEAIVHGSVIARMKADPTYRPGNLVLGGGGRVKRVAPESAGMGEWHIIRESGDLWGEAVLRKIE